MHEQKIQQLLADAMSKASDEQLHEYASGRKHLRPEQVEAANREIAKRKEQQQVYEPGLKKLSPADIMREQLLLSIETKRLINSYASQFLREQKEQTERLKNISLVATIFGIMLVLSIVVGFCVGLGLIP